jgi:hypothetical protein
MARGERVSPGQRDRLKQWDAEQAEVRRREAILAADERWLHPASKPVVVGVASGAAAETEV